MSKLYKHYSAFKEPWKWPNFTPQELSCKHCGEYFHDAKSLDALQNFRNCIGRPIKINSAHRCKIHNARVGGAAGSQHLKIAFDCRCPKAEQYLFAQIARHFGFTGVGFYPGKSFVHLDLGPAREWRG